jgi:hypothetical protein
MIAAHAERSAAPMIAYVRGRLEGPAGAGTAAIRTADGMVEARTFAPLGGAATGDEVIAASATVAVGVEDRHETVLLGPFAADRPDPGGPLGLASTPVILLPDPSTVQVALAGVARAGRAPAVARLRGSIPLLGLALLEATQAAEVIVVSTAVGAHVDLVRVIGGRAVVALPTSEAASVAAWFDDTELGAVVPVPTTDPHVLTAIASLGLEAVHQVVQVDPTPALEEAGAANMGVPVRVLTAAAAGVLAGRIAVGNRRWRADIAP